MYVQLYCAYATGVVVNWTKERPVDGQTHIGLASEIGTKEKLLPHSMCHGWPSFLQLKNFTMSRIRWEGTRPLRPNSWLDGTVRTA